MPSMPRLGRRSPPLGTRTGIRAFGGLLAVATFALFHYGLFTANFETFSVVYHRDHATCDRGCGPEKLRYDPWDLCDSGLAQRGRRIEIAGYVALFVSVVALVVPESALFFAITMLVSAFALLLVTAIAGANAYAHFTSHSDYLRPKSWTVTPPLVIAAALCVFVCFGSVLTLRSIWASRARPRDYRHVF